MDPEINLNALKTEENLVLGITEVLERGSSIIKSIDEIASFFRMLQIMITWNCSMYQK